MPLLLIHLPLPCCGAMLLWVSIHGTVATPNVLPTQTTFRYASLQAKLASDLYWPAQALLIRVMMLNQN